MFRYLIVLVVLIVSAFAAPQFGFGYPGGYGHGGYGHGGYGHGGYQPGKLKVKV
jgi:hypothetical protein